MKRILFNSLALLSLTTCLLVATVWIRKAGMTYASSELSFRSIPAGVIFEPTSFTVWIFRAEKATHEVHSTYHLPGMRFSHHESPTVPGHADLLEISYGLAFTIAMILPVSWIVTRFRRRANRGFPIVAAPSAS